MPENKVQRARILHLSDLHFGARFNKDTWQDATNKAKEWGPNLVIVTGDLVNSPWRWRMKWAKQELSALKEKLGCAVIVVPGNHDTRVVGLLPVGWIWRLVLGLALLLAPALLFLVPFAPLIGTVVSSGLALVALGLLLLRFCLAGFTKYFSAFAVPSPYEYANLGIELYAFDSATAAISGARGRIPLHQFVAARKNQLSGTTKTPGGEDVSLELRPALFRIAILHHHPLPIPYDDSAEYLMVADNAGAFLSEISRMKVRLIMHGHKHKRHFSRVTINANEPNEHEVAVLSTGTATVGSGTQRRGHNFNLLELDDYGNMKVTPWIGVGGTFESGPPFFVEQNRLADTRQYQMAVERHGIACQSNVVRFEINGEGDIFQRHEFHGLHVERDQSALKELPKPIRAKVTTGHIEGFHGAPLDQNSRETVTFVPARVSSLTEQSGTIRFGRNLLSRDKPLSFFFQYHALNALAMTKRQHAEMYGDEPRLEYVQLALTQCPSQELNMIIKFPPDFRIGGPPQLLVESNNERLADLEKKYENCVDYYQYLQLFIARIRHPPLNLKFKIQWALTDAPPPGGERTTSLVGEAEAMARGLLQLASRGSDPGIQQLLKVIEEDTRESFKLDDKSKDPIDISLMAYDKHERVLRIVAASFPMTSEMRDFRLKYGDGIAGRAYKMNAGRLFIKRLAKGSDGPAYYYPTDGKPYKLDDVEDQVIMSVPLRHPDDKTLIYGILNISSKMASSKLQDIKEASALDESSVYHKAIGLACFSIIKERIFLGGA